MDAARWWLPFGLGGAAMALLVLLAPPSFYWLDSAELTAAGVGLGSPHPTGFPLYMMLVKMASLVPFGEIGHRVNLLSALCGALCVGFVAQLVIGAGRGTLAALVGAVIAAVALTSSLLFARHAVIAEVYVPTAALFAATLLCLDRAVRSGSARTGLLLALLCGLGLGLHSSFRLLVPLPVMVFMWIRLRRGARWPLYAPVIVVVVSLALHLYLPVRSATGRIGAIDWGHPRDLSSLGEHVTAARIRAAFSDEIASSTPEVVSVNIAELAQAVFDGLGPAALLLAALGLGWLISRRRSRYLAAAAGLAIVIDFVYSFWINPMGTPDGQNGALLAVCVATLAGLGATWFLARNQRAAPFIGAFVVVLVAIGPMWVTLGTLAPASRTNVPRTIADAGLDRLAPRAIALTQSDSLSAATMYLTVIEGARPDVSVLVRQQIADVERTRFVAGLPSDAPATFRTLLETGRPIAWEMGDDYLPAELGAVADVPFVRLREKPSGDDLEAAVARARVLFASAGTDPVTLRHLAMSLTNLGRIAFGRGRMAFAAGLFDAAIAASPTHASALVNRGVVASRAGDLALALELTNRALSVEPNRIQALINAARYERALGNAETARRHLERAAAVEPKNMRVRKALETLPR